MMAINKEAEKYGTCKLLTAVIHLGYQCGVPLKQSDYRSFPEAGEIKVDNTFLQKGIKTTVSRDRMYPVPFFLINQVNQKEVV